MNNRFKSTVIGFFILLVLAIGAYYSFKPNPPETGKKVRLLAWVGYDEPDLFVEFEKSTGIDVTVDTFIGGPQMLKRLQTNPTAYDVVVLDPEFVQLAVDDDLLAPLDRGNYDTSRYHQRFKEMPETVVEGDLYAIPVRFGIVGIMYHTERVPKEVASDLKMLLSDSRLSSRISMIDLWQPSLGLIAINEIGAKDPYLATTDDLVRVQKSILRLRDGGAKIHESVPDLMNSLSDNSTWVMLGGGEANTAALISRNQPYDWLVPKQGGILWVESLGIVKGTPNRGEAVELIKFLQSAEGQVKLARRATYISSTPSLAAAELLSSEERKLRKISDEAAIDDLLSNVMVRHLPPDKLIGEWEDIWQAAKRK